MSLPTPPAVERQAQPTLTARSGRRGELWHCKDRSSFHTVQYHEAAVLQEKSSRLGRGLAQGLIWFGGGRRRRGCGWRNNVRLATARPCRRGHL